MAFTNYTISVSANTSAGEGPADMVRLRTPEDGEFVVVAKLELANYVQTTESVQC